MQMTEALQYQSTHSRDSRSRSTPTVISVFHISQALRVAATQGPADYAVT